jgi:hypothetical protein
LLVLLPVTSPVSSIVLGLTWEWTTYSSWASCALRNKGRVNFIYSLWTLSSRN